MTYLPGAGARWALRAFAALVVGLGVASVAAYIVALLLRAGGYPPANGSLGDGGLGVLPSVNVATILVASFAGIAGILSFETRSSSAVALRSRSPRSQRRLTSESQGPSTTQVAPAVRLPFWRPTSRSSLSRGR